MDETANNIAGKGKTAYENINTCSTVNNPKLQRSDTNSSNINGKR
jgi:hypothetical protein